MTKVAHANLHRPNMPTDRREFSETKPASLRRKMDGWNTFSFPIGAWDGLFSGAKKLLVSGRVL